MLTAMDGVGDRVRGLDAGADDYIVKPFAVAELLARLRAVMRRSREKSEMTLEYGGLRLDCLRREVERDGERVELTAREFDLLEYFMRNPRTRPDAQHDTAKNLGLQFRRHEQCRRCLHKLHP